MRDLADGSVQTLPTWISAQVRANREKAKSSTGPVTPEGKTISKLNATRHGLTGRQVLLPSEDADAYTAHIERLRRDFQPATEREHELTQMLADIQWRVNRIPNLESAIFAVGRMRRNYAQDLAELNDYRLKPVGSDATESRGARLKPSEAVPAESRLKAR